ncbi:hypothetical protein [Francisella sp. SYW-9]|uniref:hypothetical protein n=1 Tax=Francisella sp. SYW-9 TaxID=2610888 RepID=UPI00123C8C6F|nr:hypothetical protein [Francisella sp. SYW-9]
MNEDNNLADLISLNAVKQISKDKIIDLLYSKKYNRFFKKNQILAKMFPKNPDLADDATLSKRWEQSLIDGILPNTYPSISYQSIRLKISPFDESLSLKKDNAIEINSYFIQDLELSLDAHGFSGFIDFVYPYQTEYDDKLMGILTSGLPFQLEITIKQEFFIEDDQKDFIEENGDLSNEEIKFTGYAGNSQTKQTLIRDPKFGGKDTSLIKFDGLYKIDFCDSMSFFWQQLNPISLYSGQSYEKIFQEQNTPFSSLVKLNFDKSCDDALKQKIPFICVNCQDDNYSLYKYFLYILEEYNLLLLYNYKDEKYTITSNYKDLVSKAKPVKTIFKEDKKKIQEIKHIHEKPYLVEKSLININPKISEKQNIEVTELKSIPKKINNFKHTKTTQHDVSKLFKLKVDNYKDRLKNTFAAKSIGLEIQSYSIPCSFSLYPLQNNFKFATKEWGIILGKEDNKMILHRTKLKFEKTPLYSKNNKRHPIAFEDKQDGEIVKDKVTFEFEDTAISNSELPLMFNCSSHFYFYNEESWPKLEGAQKPHPLNIGGNIFTTKQDDENSNYASCLFDYNSDSSKSMEVNKSYSSSSKISNLDPNSISRPRYQIKVAPQLWTELTPKNKQFVPANILLPSYSNMLFYLKSGTEVEVSLLEEYADITKIKNYLAPNDMFSAGDKEQQQGIVFENRKEQSTVIKNVYKPSDKTNSFKISHNPAKNGTPSNLEMNNQSFKISVNCKK